MFRINGPADGGDAFSGEIGPTRDFVWQFFYQDLRCVQTDPVKMTDTNPGWLSSETAGIPRLMGFRAIISSYRGLTSGERS
jgi:hypothetical protein